MRWTPTAKCLVSDDHKFIYLWVPKVACTSIKTVLLPLFDIDTAVYEKIPKDSALDFDVHKLFARTDYQINKTRFHTKLCDQYRDYFKFAFVRNPWDRLVSCYRNKLEKNGPSLENRAHLDIKLYPGMPFAEFVEAVHATPDAEANAHFKSQHKVICGPGRNKPILADFVGRFENLAADFEVVAQKIGNAQKLQLPHTNRSKSNDRPYTAFYDKRLKSLVYERYQEDIEIFNYSFGDSHILPPLWQQDTEAALASLDTEMATQIWQLEQQVEELKHNLALKRREARRLTKRLKKLESSRTWKLLNRLSRIRSKVSANQHLAKTEALIKEFEIARQARAHPDRRTDSGL